MDELIRAIDNRLNAIRGYCELAKVKRERGELLASRMDDAIETVAEISELFRQLLATSPRRPV